MPADSPNSANAPTGWHGLAAGVPHRPDSAPTPAPSLQRLDDHQSATITGSGVVVQAHRDIHWYEQQLRWLPLNTVTPDAGGFAPPTRYQHAEAVLGDPERPLVVVCGPRGTGRRASALNLLADARIEIRECLTDWDAPRVDLLPREPDGRYLLDLTDEPSAVPEQFGRALAGYAADLRRYGAKMTILVTDPLWRSCRPHTDRFTIKLEAPGAETVLAARLRPSPFHLKWFETDRVLQDEVRALLTPDASPGRAAELAEIIKRRSPDNESQISTIRDEFQHWESYLQDKFSEHQADRNAGEVAVHTNAVSAARRRALLITLSILDGAPAEIVLKASDALLMHLGVEPDARDILIGPELSDLLHDVGADRVDDTITLARQRPGLDQAVLERIWRERPQLRAPIREWMEAITAENAVAASELDRVAEVLARLAIQLGSLEIIDIVQRWIAGSARHRRLAIGVLERLAISQEVGATVRRRLYTWARSKSDVQLLTGVAEVCSGLLGRRSPTIAILRLRHLLTSEHAEVHQAAATALRSLAVDESVRPHIVAAIVNWSTGLAGIAGQRGLLALVDPGEDLMTTSGIDAIAADLDLQMRLHHAWTAMIADPESQSSAIRVVRRWLACADAGTLNSGFVICLLGPALKNGLSGEEFKTFVTNAEGSKTHADLVMALITNRYPEPSISSAS